ncbi:MAG: PfkB family carbohydrate kinase [Alphaproteobacteria bacterium]
MSGGLLQMSGIVVDFVHRVPHLPSPGEEVEAVDTVITAGGGFNAMVAAKRFGIAVSYGGALGTGALADIARTQLRDHHIPALMEGQASIDQGSCVVLVDPRGERSFISRHGAERRIDPASLDRVPVAEFDWVLLSGYSLYKEHSARAFVPWLARLPRGRHFFFDPGPMVAAIPEAHLDAALARADWVSANAREARSLTGLADPAAAARRLSQGRQGALVRCGAEGCWLATPGNGVQHIDGFAVETVDTTGAGDTHDGAFIASSQHGYMPHDAAVLANAAAAISTTRHGPVAAPGLEETLAFLRARRVDVKRRATDRRVEQ